MSDKAAPCRKTRSIGSSSAAPECAVGVGFHLMLPLGPASSTSPSSSTHSREGSSAGAPRARRMRASCSTRSSRPCAQRRPLRSGLVHHSDRGVQYVSIKYTERLKDAGVEPSVGSVGDSDHNALAETINGLLQSRSDLAARAVAQLRGGRRPRSNGSTGSTTRTPLEPIGNIPPA